MDDVVLIVKFRAKEGCEDALERVLTHAVTDAYENDPGVVRFVLHRGIDDPRTFVLYEWFRSRQALQDRRQRPSTADIRTAIHELRESAEELFVEPVPTGAPDVLDPGPPAGLDG